MKVIILGCGRVGSTIATTMAREGHEITIIDQNPDAFRRLGADFAGRTFVGNGIDEDALVAARIGEADAFVAVTNGDNRNIMSAQLARQAASRVPREAKAPLKVIARMYDPIRAQVYGAMGIQTICTTSIGAGVMHDMILGEEFKPVDEYRRFGLDGPAAEESHG